MLTTGGLLVSIALLVVAAVAPLFHSSDPPEWTTRRWVGDVVTIAFVSSLAIGLGYLGVGIISAVQSGPDYLDLGGLAGVLVVAVVIWGWLRARARPSSARADARPRRAPVSGQMPGDRVLAAAEEAPASPATPATPHRAA